MEKFIGAETWGLRPVVEFLPTLLLISLCLFFIALVDYLWSINKTVAFVVLAFSLVGMVAYWFTVIAAAISLQSPFQTSASIATRKIAIKTNDLVRRLILPVIRRLSRKARVLGHEVYKNVWAPLKSIPLGSVRRKGSMVADGRFLPAARHIFLKFKNFLECLIARIREAARSGAITQHDTLEEQRGDEQSRASVRGLRCTSPELLDPISRMIFVWTKVKRRLPGFHARARSLTTESKASWEGELHARSVLWMLEVANEEEDLVSIAENLPALHNLEVVQLIARSPLFLRLVSRYRDSVTFGHPNALPFTRAVAHVFGADPMRCYRMIWAGLASSEGVDHELADFLQGNDRLSPDVAALHGSITALCCRCFRDSFRSGSGRGLSNHDILVFEAFEAAATFKYPAKRAIFEVPGKRAISSMGDVQRTTALSAMTLVALSGVSDQIEMLIEAMPEDDAFFNLASLTIRGIESITREVPLQDRLEEVWLARTGQNTGYFMKAAIECDAANATPEQLLSFATLLRQFSRHHPKAGIRNISQLLTIPWKTVLHDEAPRVWVASEIFSLSITSGPPSYPGKKVAGHEAAKWLHTVAGNLSRTALALINHANLEFPSRRGKRALRSYLLQLLVSLDCSDLVGEWNIEEPQVRAIAQALITLEAGPSEATSDRDISSLLRIFIRILYILSLSDRRYLLSNPSIVSLLSAAMASRTRVKSNFRVFLRGVDKTDELESFDTSPAVFKLLDCAGAHLILSDSIGSPFMGVTGQLGCAVVENLKENILKGSMDITELYDLQGLVGWLTESARRDASLAMSFMEAGVAFLFMQGLSNGQSRRMERGGEKQKIIKERILLLLGLLYTATRATSYPERQTLAKEKRRLKAEEYGAVANKAEFTTLAEYMEEFMQTRNTSQMTNPDVRLLFRQTFLVVECAFIFEPEAASAAKLDLASEGLVDWLIETQCEEWVHQELQLDWLRARNAYAGSMQPDEHDQVWCGGEGDGDFSPLEEESKVLRIANDPDKD
ncbi:hypothetical protein FRB94_005602 [Tulasnella sp. JGI-2019a]|nr:hypothetical protein FRB94_005602 [Tulasnella sp. JGI-2019a]